jgi:peptide/nickel transport system substrate-binding protein
VKNKFYVLIAVLVLASMVLSACGGAGGAATSNKKVTISYSQEPDNVRLEYSNMTYSAWLDQIIDAGLATYDNTDTYVPELASEIPTTANGGVSADGLTITWKLKPNLKWSDGQPITSKDVLFTWQSQIDPKNAVVSVEGFRQISSIDTPDDLTAVVHYSELYPAWQLTFAVGAQGISGGLLPAHLLQGKTGLEKDPEIHSPTAAAGPFMIKEWVAGDHMSLVPNPNWYGDKPKLSQIDIKFVPDPETALAALKTGDVDMNPDFAESDIPTITALEPKVHLRVDNTPSFEHLFFNLGITNSTIKDANGAVIGNSDVAGFCPFQDVNVRKAFMLATDRDTIAKTLLYGKVTVPASLWPNSPWYNSKLTPYPYDADQANQLLDTAGYPKGSDGIRAGTCGGQPVKFSLGVETTNKQVRVDTMNAMADMYKKIGVELKPNPLPAGTFFGSYTEGADMQLGKFDFAIFTTGFYPDPNPADYFLCSGIPNKDHQSGQNLYHYCDQTGQMDKLMAAANASADPAVRKTAFDAIQQYQYDNVIFIPLYARANVSAYTDRFIFPKTSAYCYFACPSTVVQWDVK